MFDHNFKPLKYATLICQDNKERNRVMSANTRNMPVGQNIVVALASKGEPIAWLSCHETASMCYAIATIKLPCGETVAFIGSDSARSYAVNEVLSKCANRDTTSQLNKYDFEAIVKAYYRRYKLHSYCM